MAASGGPTPPHGVILKYDNVTFTATDNQVTVVFKVAGQPDKVVVLEKSTGKILSGG